MGAEYTEHAVREFLALASERIAEARTQSSTLTHQTLGHLIHPILQGASDLGADELAWVCRRMARLTDSGDTTTALALLPMLDSRYREASTTMLAMIGSR